MKHLERSRSIFWVSGLMLALSVLFFVGSILTMGRSKAHAQERASQKLESRSEKEVAAESDSFIQASKSFAENLLEQHAKCPLLDEYAKEHFADSSLENMINDVNAGHSAKEAILAVCEKAGLDASAAKIGDLTKEQIIEIDQEVFCSSNHPIGE